MYARTMNSTQTLTETAGAPKTDADSEELVALATLGALQSIWARFAPGVVAVILAAGLSVVGWLMAQQITSTNQDIKSVKTDLEADIVRVEERITGVEESITRVEDNLREDIRAAKNEMREDIARVEVKIDDLLVSLGANRATSVNQ